ncbi:hypothetical protein DD238_008217 [Peronospora effusa]|uniref:Uncharacterized protein n=1 Tax=Peronospora effusa TaxID=542832 RepID=A0A3M6VAE8_9STRA|nr:hypothetical protein DD238_008217 [Peronospora effusa]RQM11706.1 hypothetical protein DD237_008290 [Peronospora effusa]
MALSRTGQVFSWGSNSFGQLGHLRKSMSSQNLTPKRVHALRFRVMADIAASGCHSAAIDTDDGSVYTWGSNRRGQLGRKEGCGTDQVDATPRIVDALCPLHPMSALYGNCESVRAEKVALSDWHTCVVLRCSHNGCSIGQVWQFGYGSYRPSRVNFPSVLFNSGVIMSDKWVPTCKQRDMDIVDISCAQNHSIALSASGSVFTWGHNVPALSQQPSGSLSDRRADTPGNTVAKFLSSCTPQLVPLCKYGTVNSVCASQTNCAVVTQQGDLVTWGCGQQGHERENTWQPSPKRVAGVKKAISVAAGHQHTAVLVVPMCPDFDTTVDVTGKDCVASLKELVEKTIAAHVNVYNCALVWYYAERYAAHRLQNYCLEYMQNNWDAVLDTSGLERMKVFFEIMLPPMEELVPKEKSAVLAPIDDWENHAKKKRAVKISKSLPFPVRKDESVAGGYDGESLFTTLPAMLSKSNGRRKRRSNKFVLPASFLLDKTFASTTRGISSPWSLHTAVEEDKSFVGHGLCASPASQVSSSSPTASHAFLEAFPLPKSSVCNGRMDDCTPRQRKARIGGHSSPRSSISPISKSKHMLGYDGIEHEKVTAFSLDAFLKQPACRSTRGKRLTSAVPIWNSPSTDSAVASKQKSLPPKTLKEIQEEEETVAAREREVKARFGSGTVPTQQSQSTVNSWGLFRPPDPVSLADVQKLQEKQHFIEQQHQILADIKREQAEKSRAAAAALLGVQNMQMTATNNRGSKAYKRERKTASTAAGCNVSTAAMSGSTGDYQSKQNKLKKVKERKAARR